MYESIATWCFEHQVETDLIAVTLILWGIVALMRRQRRKRRILHRFLWGCLMKREDREKYQKMRFEDALTDAAMEMTYRGEMSSDEEKRWYLLFADKYDFVGLIPGKNVKMGIRARLKQRYGLKSVHWPGSKPGVEHTDTSYDPVAPIQEGLISSKYVR